MLQIPQRETTGTFPSASVTSPQQTLVSTTVWVPCTLKILTSLYPFGMHTLLCFSIMILTLNQVTAIRFFLYSIWCSCLKEICLCLKVILEVAGFSNFLVLFIYFLHVFGLSVRGRNHSYPQRLYSYPRSVY